MQRIIFWAFLFLLGSSLLGATVFGGQIAGAAGQQPARRTAPTPSHVIVDNTPLPVSGTVNVGTMPNVKLDPTGNTVQLAAGASVKTTAADDPALQPVNTYRLAEYSDGVSSSYTNGLYTVPPGKELVIEQVTFDARLPNGEDLTFAQIVKGGGGRTGYDLNVSHVAADFNSSTAIFGSTQTRIYVEAGLTPFCQFNRWPATGAAFVYCSMSGHLVDVP